MKNYNLKILMLVVGFFFVSGTISYAEKRFY